MPDAGQMRVFHAADERIPEAEDSLAEQTGFEISVHFWNFSDEQSLGELQRPALDSSFFCGSYPCLLLLLELLLVHAFINAATFSLDHLRIDPAAYCSEPLGRKLVLDC